MRKRKCEIASWILQGLYCALCAADVVICLIYRGNFGNAIGRACAELGLHLTVILFLFPALPVGMALNICALRGRSAADMPRRGWLVWTILSPVVYIASWITACCVFVAMTGGV